MKTSAFMKIFTRKTQHAVDLATQNRLPPLSKQQNHFQFPKIHQGQKYHF